MHRYTFRTRYNEVDKMGYVYHGNYVAYCHQARTEFMRELGIHDHELEATGIMMPVIDMQLKYHQPASYDDQLTITTKVKKLTHTRLTFSFEIKKTDQKICTASSTIVFVNTESRKPMRVPKAVEEALSPFILAF